MDDLIAFIGAVVIISRIIVKITPTPKDDTVLAKVLTVLSHLGLKL